MLRRYEIIILAFLVLVTIVFFLLPGGAGALTIVVVTAASLLWVFRRYADDKGFVTTIFLGGLLVRLAFGLFVHVYDLRDFFGGDANTYDFLGRELLMRWTDTVRIPNPTVEWQLSNSGSGWGMFDLVAAIYYLVGNNILAAQSFCGVVGAAIAPMVYFCAQKVFQNNRVARTSAFLVAFFPAFIIWSGQLLKDGLIIFLLVLSMTMILELQRKFSYQALLTLFLSVAAVLPLRFYIFYILGIAIVASLVIAFSTSAKATARNMVILVFLGLGLTYIGVTRNANSAFEQYGTLARLQGSRLDLAQSAKSGFASDADVSTTEGAIGAIPVGLTYLMLAPFPWEAASFRSSVTIPEVMVWWVMLPFMVYGIIWSLKNRLRRSFPILLFSLLLSVAYSIFQGNVGTAYRQRTQIQVFLIMFVAVAWTLLRERSENRRLLQEAHRRAGAARLKTRLTPASN